MVMNPNYSTNDLVNSDHTQKHKYFIKLDQSTK